MGHSARLAAGLELMNDLNLLGACFRPRKNLHVVSRSRPPKHALPSVEVLFVGWGAVSEASRGLGLSASGRHARLCHLLLCVDLPGRLLA